MCHHTQLCGVTKAISCDKKMKPPKVEIKQKEGYAKSHTRVLNVEPPGPEGSRSDSFFIVTLRPLLLLSPGEHSRVSLSPVTCDVTVD